MNKNNHDNNTEAVKIANALKPFAKKWFDEWGKSCLRSKKMTVSTAPNGTVIGVKDAFSDTEMFVKYMAECSSAQVGDTVWCKWMYDNMQTLYADSMGDISEKDVTFNNVTVDSVLDVTQRRCYATLSSAGWYRVMIADYPSAETEFMRGKAAPLIRFGISRKGDAVTSETHEILLMSGGWDAIKFVDEKSACASLLIDKIRYTYNSSNSKAYVDIHYNASNGNAVGVTLAVTTPTSAIFGQIKAASLEAVADAPSGETVLTTHEFAANTKGIISIPTAAISGSAIVDSNASRCGDIAFYSFGIQANSYSEPISVEHGQVIARGFLPPLHAMVVIGTIWNGVVSPLRCILRTDGTLAVYWDSGQIPVNGSAMVFDFSYVLA